MIDNEKNKVFKDAEQTKEECLKGSKLNSEELDNANGGGKCPALPYNCQVKHKCKVGNEYYKMCRKLRPLACPNYYN